MNLNKLPSCFFVLLTISIFSGCSSFTDNKGFGVNYDRRTAGTIIDDNGLSIRAYTALTKDKELWKECHISSVTYNNHILLVGQAPTEELKARAVNLLLKFVNKDQIYNQITVEEPISISVKAKDSWITTQVKGKLLANKNIGINRTKVITENGVVYLMGILTKEEEKLATDLARKTKGVDKVIKILTEYKDFSSAPSSSLYDSEEPFTLSPHEEPLVSSPDETYDY